MIRLFNNHQVRKYQELDGLWDFQPIDENCTIKDVEKYDYQLPIPSCWESHPSFANYRGKAAYRKKIFIQNDTHVHLVCKGISHTAEIYFDRSYVTSHYNAYTPFSHVIKHVKQGEHELVILVDNRFTDQSSLHIPNDYYTYGGIIRPVAVELMDSIMVNQVKSVPVKVGESWNLELEVDMELLDDSPDSYYLKGIIANQTFTIDLKKTDKNKRISHSITGLDVSAWSPNSPHLYQLELQIVRKADEVAVDDYIERIGFREVTTANGKIQVNGEDIVLKGFNRHEDHAIVGASFPLSLMVKDLELMKDMGANAVRTSHYPNDELFLDLCDELGFLVWEENHARGLSLERMQHPLFRKQCEQVNREMVENHYNHPSIIIWGILNECASNTEQGREIYQEQLEQIRALDQSRPLTFASHHRAAELCFDLVDIVSFNLYPQWYTDEDPSDLADQARKWADESGGAGKPMIMSEFGADGLYGYRCSTAVKGTEERQAMIIEANLAAYMKKDYLSGMFIWQFADCRVTEEEWFMTRAGTQNNKGIVNGYRQPKQAYHIVKNKWG
ncbi:glycoside hydrolase family 2 protein [Gracilibacillus saliphilus]|uniref:glycoside hydrolase family 2 protein n=1 Tax=Gracilibacillus saliphilus TaxID=543890 RepID=UPI0013D302F7|nr:glycoside hydrolase family 2 TIM barrel-domain containing protein [Gracilibacillus saliphilus]